MNSWVSGLITSFLASSITATLNRLNERRKCRPFIDVQLIDKSKLEESKIGIAELKKLRAKENIDVLDSRSFEEPYYLKITNLSDFPCYEVRCEAIIHNYFGKEHDNKMEYTIPKLKSNEILYINVLKEIMLQEQIDTDSIVAEYNTGKRSKFDIGCFVYSRLIDMTNLMNCIKKCKHDMSNLRFVRQELKPVVNDKDTYKLKTFDFSFSSEQFEKLKYKFVPSKHLFDNSVEEERLYWKNRRQVSSLFRK